MNDLISVVVPVYNAKKYIKQCLSSLINQTYTYLEIIVVNDGSIDGTDKILDLYAKKDKRLKVIHTKNSGSVIARRIGVKSVSKESKYICFCDADDIMPLNSIATLYNHIVNDESDICVGNSTRLFKGVKMRTRRPPSVFLDNHKLYNHKEFINKLYCSWFGVSNVPVGLVGKLYKTELINEVYFDVPDIVSFFGDDLIQTINLFPKAKRITFINQNIYNYRIGGGTSKYQPKMMDDWIALYNYKKELYKNYSMPQDVEYLLDIELCNMTFTYFEMLFSSKKASIYELKEEIKNTCVRSEVKHAANHIKMVSSGFNKAKMIREGLYEEIYMNLCINYKKNSIQRNIKKLILFFN